MKMSKVSPKFVPHLLTDEQKIHRMELCRQNLDRLKADTSLLEKVITMDESWFSVFEPDTKQDSLEWRTKGVACPKKAIRNRAVRKTMAILFFDTVGIVHLEFLPPRQTMDSDFWIAVLKRLKESIRRKQPILGREDLMARQIVTLSSIWIMLRSTSLSPPWLFTVKKTSPCLPSQHTAQI